MSYQDVALFPSHTSLPPHFLIIVVDAKASERPHVLKVWLGVSNGMLPAKYFSPNKSSFWVSQISWKSQGCHKDEVNLTTLTFGILPDLKQWCLSDA